MAGMLKSKNPAIDGCVSGDTRVECSNPLDPDNATAGRVYADDEAVYIQPADPAHGIPDTTFQLFGQHAAPASNATGAPMDGFIKSYDARIAKSKNASTLTGAFIMKCFSPEHVPVIDTLAQEFQLYDRYFSGVPGPTMVNRAFAQSGTSNGMGSNNVVTLAMGLPQKNIFEMLDEAVGGDADPWRVYFEDLPSSIMFNYTRTATALSRFRGMDKFYDDVQNGDLPTLSWLEPAYADLGFIHPASDQHPDHDVAEGEKLIKKVYESLRAADTWNETMLIVTYDEHGGFWDHVSPPAAPSPDGKVSTSPPFDFERLGVRVPMIIASPYTPKGQVVHEAPGAASGGGHYEHSSIPETLRRMLAPEQAPLTHRSAWAAPLDPVALSLSTPRTDCPTTLPDAPSHRRFGALPPPDGRLPCTELQQTLVHTLAGAAGAPLAQATLERMSELECGRLGVQHVNRLLGREEIVV